MTTSSDDHAKEWQIRQSSRASTSLALGSKLAHELGTPLNVILGRASLIEDDPEANDGLKRHAEIIASQARKIRAILDEHLARVRAPHDGVERRTLPLRPIVEDAVEIASPRARQRDVTFSFAPGGEVDAKLDPPLATQAIVDVLEQAAALTIAGGTVRLDLDVAKIERPAARRCPPGTYARISATATPAPGTVPSDDTTLALASADGALRSLGGFAAAEPDADGIVHLCVCFPTP